MEPIEDLDLQICKFADLQIAVVALGNSARAAGAPVPWLLGTLLLQNDESLTYSRPKFILTLADAPVKLSLTVFQRGRMNMSITPA